MRLVSPDRLDIGAPRGTVDLAVAIWMVHKVANPLKLFEELATSLKHSARLILAEPGAAVSVQAFEEELALAARAGLSLEARPGGARSLGAVLVREVYGRG